MKFNVFVLLLTFCAASLPNEPDRSLMQMEDSLQAAIKTGDMEAFQRSLDLDLLHSLDDPKTVKELLLRLLQPIAFGPKGYACARVLLEYPETRTKDVLAIGFHAFLNGAYQPEPEVLLQMVQLHAPSGGLLSALKDCEKGGDVEGQLLATMKTLGIKIFMNYCLDDPEYSYVSELLLNNDLLDGISVLAFLQKAVAEGNEEIVELCLRTKAIPEDRDGHLTFKLLTQAPKIKIRHLLAMEPALVNSHNIVMLISNLGLGRRTYLMKHLLFRFGQEESLMSNLEAYIQLFKDCKADNVEAFSAFDLPLGKELLSFLEDGFAGPNVARLVRGRLGRFGTQIGLALAWLNAVGGDISQMPSELQMILRLIPYLNELPISQAQALLDRIDRTGASKDAFFTN